MRCVIMIGYGPNWAYGKTVYEQGSAITGHLEAMRRHYNDGTLLLGGPFEGDGGVAVVEVPDAAAAADLMDADPGVVAGVLRYDVHTLLAYFDAFAGTAVDGSVEELQLARQS